MNPSENPLDQLRDIHLPEQIHQLQLAPGWWVIIGLALLLAIYVTIKWRKKRQALALLGPANDELDKIANLSPDSAAIAELSALLKRICLVYFPKQQVAALSGDNWTGFLNQQIGRELFNPDQQKTFSQLAYQANPDIDPNTWRDTIENSRIAINTIIRQAAKERQK